MSITLRQIQIFLAVAQSKNLSEAADQLNITKSAVSQSLSDLESRLGVTLLDRNKNRSILSAEGRSFKSVADELVRRAMDAEQFFQRPSTGQVHLDVTLSIGAFYISSMLHEYFASTTWLPEVTVANTAEVSEHLENFTTDLAIVEGPMFHLDIITEPWLKDELVVVAPKGHRLTQGVATWDQLSKERWILREPGSSTRIFFDAQLSQRLSSTAITTTINSFEAIIGMVMKGMGLTFMTSKVLTDPFYSHRIEKVTLPEVFERQLSLCWHRDKFISRDMEQWLDFCRQWAKRKEAEAQASKTDASSVI